MSRIFMHIVKRCIKVHFNIAVAAYFKSALTFVLILASGSQCQCNAGAFTALDFTGVSTGSSLLTATAESTPINLFLWLFLF